MVPAQIQCAISSTVISAAVANHLYFSLYVLRASSNLSQGHFKSFKCPVWSPNVRCPDMYTVKSNIL